MFWLGVVDTKSSGLILLISSGMSLKKITRTTLTAKTIAAMVVMTTKVAWPVRVAWRAWAALAVKEAVTVTLAVKAVSGVREAKPV